ncbi:hypothetical protein roselon_01300 [Roseibacterium elongatum DSM 19469]|uniref:Uncharacterized protein n=1 Tax=Roseicyclus elongatus DSM 19469 TaxID=1294273 RepID=W8RRH9_9RHOB|nr:hypothetical protein roselon_01300 [Roseibacterium elongatum DSM 19469]
MCHTAAWRGPDGAHEAARNGAAGLGEKMAGWQAGNEKRRG